jgi:hypothetical protein
MTAKIVLALTRASGLLIACVYDTESCAMQILRNTFFTSDKIIKLVKQTKPDKICIASRDQALQALVERAVGHSVEMIKEKFEFPVTDKSDKASNVCASSLLSFLGVQTINVTCSHFVLNECLYMSSDTYWQLKIFNTELHPSTGSSAIVEKDSLFGTSKLM